MDKIMFIKIIDISRWAKIDQSCFSELPNYWRRLRMVVFKRDNYQCVYCGDKNGPFEADHVFPRSRGGEDTESNLVCSCRKCNQSKRDKTPEEWGWTGNIKTCG
ncbi:MAG: HNH endonuclease [Candidatus Marinimicrobia bacterium]|nr:HNH endonuclease [Candidatus Neomarinimicrobiota bacterium]MCK9483372.1 HNH endonuclease [Candidatus Neomarinimicrobiota bacterium]